MQALTRRIEANPQDVNLFSARGDARFFLGEFAKSVDDFNQMIELDRSLGDSHWRRGIACFYAGQYEAAAKQFEVYHSFDNIDRENGIWRYLSQVKAVGREKAREGMLKYEKDDREPFPDIYRLFGGTITGEELLRKIEAAELPAAEKEKRLFYAELYVGLNDAVEGRAEGAETHLAKSTANRWGAKAGGGPGWMWHVGRVHHDLLRAEREKKADLKPR
ncbi:MAG: tetratricopeptide repeat protein [Planctomycetaceae bacterium]